MGLFSFVKKAVATVTKPVGKALSAVSKVPVLGTVVKATALPFNVAAGIAKHGPKGALGPVNEMAKDPTLRVGLKVAAIGFPVLAPVAVMQEVAIKSLDALKSGDPKRMAEAAFSLAATQAEAKMGNADAKRAIEVIAGVKRAQSQLTAAVKSGSPAAMAKVAKNPAAQLLYARAVIKTATTSKDPKARAAAKKAGAELMKTPNGKGLLTSVHTAMKETPKTVEALGFSVSRQGRVYKGGRLLRA